MPTQGDLTRAIEDFHKARARARREQFLAWLRGESSRMICYDEVHEAFGSKGGRDRGLQDIPLDAVVGSLSRCQDFTRSFLPLRNEDVQRWARVKLAVEDLTGLPPIEVYKIGDIYFVLDGNHRVSIARQLGASHIQAYVTEFDIEVPISPDDQPDDVIIKAEYSQFLQHTHLDKVRPEADLAVSVPGQYPKLEDHISTHRYFMGIEAGREVGYQEAVTHWYDEVYEPVVHIIREMDLLSDFPDRTETDLYLWIMQHQAEMADQLDRWVRPEMAAEDLVDRSSPGLKHVLGRALERVQQALLPEEIEPGPKTGKWRERAQSSDGRLFQSILTAINGRDSGWIAVEQAIAIARQEKGQVIGLHVVPGEKQRESEATQAIQAAFERRCREAGVAYQWVLETGQITPTIHAQGRWTDLVVAHLAHPPGNQPLDRLSSGFRSLVQRSVTPILVVPQATSSFNRALLAYDGSPKAREALFVSTYMVGKWDMSLVILTVMEDEHTASDAFQQARAYLEERGVPVDERVTFVEQSGPVAETILQTAQDKACDLIVMGGYGFTPILQVVLGSAVDAVLRGSRQPVLICR